MGVEVLIVKHQIVEEEYSEATVTALPIVTNCNSSTGRVGPPYGD